MRVVYFNLILKSMLLLYRRAARPKQGQYSSLECTSCMIELYELRQARCVSLFELGAWAALSEVRELLRASCVSRSKRAESFVLVQSGVQNGPFVIRASYRNQ